MEGGKSSGSADFTREVRVWSNRWCCGEVSVSICISINYKYIFAIRISVDIGVDTGARLIYVSSSVLWFFRAAESYGGCLKMSGGYAFAG